MLGYPGFRKVADNTFNTVAGTPEANFSSATGPNNLLFLGPYTVLSNPLALVDGIQCAMTRSNRILTKPKPIRRYSVQSEPTRYDPNLSNRILSEPISSKPTRPGSIKSEPSGLEPILVGQPPAGLIHADPAWPGVNRSNQKQAAPRQSNRI